jgi:ribonucleoside-diphosphate reductase alpha chain
MDSYSLCCLGSINLSLLVKNAFTKDAVFDISRFIYLITVGVRFLDNVLDATDYPLEKIEENSKKWRRIGLGITGLADALLMLGIRYGSKESTEFIDVIGQYMADTAYETSAYLAKEKGAFPAYVESIANTGFIRKLHPTVRDKIHKYGLRNIGLLTIPPVGTTSFTVGNNCSSGIEPIFALDYERAITQEDGTRKSEKVYDYGWLKYKEHFKGNKRTEYVVTAHDISIQESISVQASFQKWIDHSISKTLNIPENTPLQEYKSLFMSAWEKKLKGITSFREGTMEGILSTKTNSARLSPKRPTDLECDIYTMQVNKQRVVALVGLYEGAPYEVFITDDPDKELRIKNRTKGIIRKVKSGKYDLILDEECIIEDIGMVFNHDWGTLGRMLSSQLRHNIPLQFIVEQLNKTQSFGTFSKAVARVLKKYMQIIVERKAICPECGEKMVNEGGCITCKACGWSKCE